MPIWFNADESKKESIRKWLIALGAIFLILLIASFFIYYDVEKNYANRIYPGIYVGNIDFSGLSHEQASMILNQKIEQIKLQGIPFVYQNNKTTLFPVLSSSDTESEIKTINFLADRNINEAFNHGRGGNFFSRLRERVNLSIRNKYFPIIIDTNNIEIDKFLQDNFSQFQDPGKDAQLVYNNEKFEIKKEKNGTHINFTKGIETLNNNLAKLDNSEITLNSETDVPKILKENCVNLESEALVIASRTPFYLTYTDKKWTINKEDLANWLSLKIESHSILKDKIIVSIDQEKVANYLREKISPKINIAVADAKFAIQDGKISEFQGSHDGLEVNAEESANKIAAELTEGCLAGKGENCTADSNKIELITASVKSTIHTDDANNIGIKEIIGTGHSNFKGSSKNRVHNIQTGAAAVNGTLIKPNEEFSLLKTLGKINKDSGYLPELVIKDNKTVPEDGGGLCQIGTTVFRATIDAGLPVTNRRNHSYRVSYYEPAGTDATIYDPAPDYKFLNDTHYNILIQSRFEGTNLYFDFWSTEDGRIATSTYPTIYNIVKPAPKKIVETLSLKPGETKCTEHAHNGADAYFDYTINYPNGEEKKQHFSSHYVPWQEVCLVGVKELTATASSTPTSTATPSDTTTAVPKTETPAKTTTN